MLDFEVLEGISIMATLVINMTDTSASFLFSFYIGFMNAESILNIAN